jgi:hypothetical protein
LKLYGHDQRSFPPTSIATEDIKKAISDEMCMTARRFLIPAHAAPFIKCQNSYRSSTLCSKNNGRGNETKMKNGINEQVNDFTKIAKHYIPSQNLKHQTLK